LPWGRGNGPGGCGDGPSDRESGLTKIGAQHNAPHNNNNNNNRPNKQRTIQYGLELAFCKLMHLMNPASRDGRAVDKILEEEILFLNRLWSFCED